MGSGWEAAYVTYLFALAGVNVIPIEKKQTFEVPSEVITIGNGDLLRRAEQALGEPLARDLWKISKQSAARAKQLFEKLSFAHQTTDAHWLDDSENEKLVESGLAFAPGALRLTLHAATQAKNRIVSDATSFSFSGQGVEVLVKNGGVAKRISCERVFLLEDEAILKLSPSMKEELIPVTLSLFEEKSEAAAPPGYFLFHSGADFAFVNSGKILMGSFRNLFADKAVGFLKNYDPATWKGVSQFFSKRGWVKPSASPSRPILKGVSLSCDGLPLVGPLRDSPSVFVSTGFSGRDVNFQFEVLAQVVDSLVKGTPLETPLSSNRRFL